MVLRTQQGSSLAWGGFVNMYIVEVFIQIHINFLEEDIIGAWSRHSVLKRVHSLQHMLFLKPLLIKGINRWAE